MPPRKSNVSAISTNEDGGTPTKEPRDGVNVEVKPHSLIFRSNFPAPLQTLAPIPFPILSTTYTRETPFLVHGGSSSTRLNVSPMSGLPLDALLGHSQLGMPPPGQVSYFYTIPFRAFAGQVPPQGQALPGSIAAADASLPPQDLSLPKTMVQRLAKGVLPPNTQIQKDSILAMQKGATVFVNYLAQA